MKDKSLFRKGMLLILIPCILLSFLLIVIAQNAVKDYFRDESFRQLNVEIEKVLESINERAKGTPEENRNALNSILSRFAIIKGAPLRDFKPLDQVSYTYLIELKDGSQRALTTKLPFIDEVKDLIDTSENWPAEGEYVDNNDNVFFSVNKVDGEINEKMFNNVDVKDVYLVAYISESYSIELTRRVMFIFLGGIGSLLLCVIIMLAFVFRKISKRLHHLEEGTAKIGKGQFDTLIDNKPSDEIGRLGEAMNRMGKQLAIIQEEKADNLQVISHELKTPIMVIQGYMDALIHEQYPNGTKEASYKIITDELGKLESLTKDLILLNKADYLARNNVEMKNLKLSVLFQNVIDKLHVDEIEIRVNGEHELVGDEESWLRIIENILTNQVRYAKSLIIIDMNESITVYNDGEHIEELLMDKIMKPFVKGKSGRSGLGLTIIINTLKLYQYSLKIENVDNGVLYTINKS